MTYSQENAKTLDIDIISQQIDFNRLRALGDMVSCLYYLLGEAKRESLGYAIVESIDSALTVAMREAHSIYHSRESYSSAEYVQAVIDDDVAFIEHFCSITSAVSKQDLINLIKSLC